MTRAIYGNIDLLNNQILNVRLQNVGVAPATNAGTIYYNTGDNYAYYYQAGGTPGWVKIGGVDNVPAGGDLSGTYPNPQIAAGVIVDADVNASAAIQQSKILNLTSDLALKVPTSRSILSGNGLTGGGTLASDPTLNVGAGTGITVNADDIAVNRAVVDTWYVDTAGDTMTGFLTLNADPTNPLHATTKQYVDLLSQGLDYKGSVKAASTGNLTLSAPQTVDGISLIAGDRVLVKDQSTASQNGIYLVAAGAWTRTTDADGNGEISDGTLVPVEGGTTNGDSLWICTATGATPWVAGTSTSTWTRYSSVADLVAGAGLTKTGNTIDVGADGSTTSVAADTISVIAAPKLLVGRTVTLTGDVTGVSGAFDGSANISYATAIAAGVIVDADVNASAAIQQSKISGLTTSLSGKVDTTRSVIAGNGLTGGGTLAADVTLNVVGDANLSVTADQVAVLSAPKWTTARTITLTGDVTGTSAAWDGSAVLSFATTLAATAPNAAKRYAAALTASTSQVVTHNLNTRDVIVNVYNSAAPYEEVDVEVQMTTVNTVTILANPALPTGYRAVVLA